jgi:hypothetical protein
MARSGVNIRVGFDLKEFSKSSQNLSRSLKKTAKQMKSVGKSMSTALTLPILAMAGVAVKAAADIETLKTSLQTALGGTSKETAEAFKNIEKFASKTPFALNEVTMGFIKLKNMGLDPSMDALKSYGNTASAMGKSLNDIVEAVADAAVGEFERLKEFGIKAKSEGDNVSFTFKGVTKTIGKNSKEIEQYLKGIGETEFAGGMDAQSKTLNGILSTMKDNFSLAAASIGEVMLPEIKKLASFLSGLANGFRSLSPETKKIIVIVAGLVAAIGPLIFAVGALTAALAFLAANPIVLIITGIILVIAALAAGVYYVVQNWEALTDRFKDINWWKNALIDMAKFFVQHNPLSLLLESWNWIFKKLGVNLNLDAPIKGLISKLDGLKTKTTEYKTEVKSLGETFKGLKDTLIPPLEAAEAATGKAIKGISKAIGSLSTIKPNITFPIDVKLDLTNIPQQIEMLDLGVSKFGEKIEDFKQGVKGLLTNFAVDVGMFLAEALGDAMSGGFEGKDFGKAALSMLGGFMKQMGALMITYAAEMALFSASIANPLLWPVALAAGIAMVAAGAAISNLGSEGVGSTSSSGGGSSAPAPSYSNNGYSENYSNSMDIRISGRDLILVQERERAFRR